VEITNSIIQSEVTKIIAENNLIKIKASLELEVIKQAIIQIIEAAHRDKFIKA
jgi:hypothetical protein